jgi:hypothetical protein
MASTGVKISQMPAAAPLNGSEQIEVAQSGESRRALLSNLISALNGSFVQQGIGVLVRTMLGKAQEIATPYDFGAVGDGVTDDTVALQAFFDDVVVNPDKARDWTGTFAVSARIYIGDAAVFSYGVVIKGACKIIARETFAITNLVTLRYLARPILGSLWVVGNGGATYANRLVDNGVLMDNCQRAYITSIVCDYMRGNGVVQKSFSGSNSSGLVVDYLAGRWCGSGSYIYDWGSGAWNSTYKLLSLTGAWSNPVNTGSASSIAQRTTVDVTVLPPTLLDAIGNFGANQVFALIGGERFYITAVDRVLSKITVFPWVPSTYVPGEIVYIFGAAIKSIGADSNENKIALCEGYISGIGQSQEALYGSNFSSVINQFCGIGVVVGASTASSAIGTVVGKLYSEGCYEDVLKVATGNNSIATIKDITVSGARPFAAVQMPRTTDTTFAYGFVDAGFWTVRRNGIDLFPYKQRRNNLESGSVVNYVLDQPNKFQIFNRTSWNEVRLSIDITANSVSGVDSGCVAFIGTGTNGAPTGTFTFTLKSDAPVGATINGGASAAFAGFAGPAMFVVEYIFSTNNFLVYPLGAGYGVLNGSKTFDWASLATGAQQTTTVTVTGAALGDFADASMSISLGGTILHAYVSAADTVTVVQRNDTGGAVDLASGTLRARVRKV